MKRVLLIAALAVVWIPLATSASRPAEARAAVEAAGIPALFQSSFVHEARGETADALNDVLKILRHDGKHYVATLRAGWLYYLRGRYADSVDHYERAVQLAPRAVEPKLGVMLPLMAAGHWSRAELIGREVLKAAPGNYLARTRLAWIAYNLGRYKDAERAYRDVLAHYPSDLDMQLGLAWTLARQGRTQDARAAFEAVLAIRPDHVKARAGLQAL